MPASTAIANGNLLSRLRAIAETRGELGRKTQSTKANVMATQLQNAIIQTVNTLLNNKQVKRATAFISPTFTVVATNHNKPSAREKSVTVVLTMGKPNHANRLKIKQLIAAKEPFPVKNVALKFYPAKAKKKK